MSHIFGAHQRPGARPPKHGAGSKKIIRWALQQLEKLKYIKKDKDGDDLKANSRILTLTGQKDMNHISTAIAIARKAK